MFGYEFRVDYSDGTYDVLTVEAASLAEAKAQVAGLGQTTLLCTIDRKPQVFLAW